CGDERVGRERSLGDAQEQRTSGCGASTVGDHSLVLFAEAELIHLLLEQEGGVAHVFHFDPAHHLAHDHLDVLVADGYTLEAIDLLDFVDQVSLEFFFAQNRQDVVRVQRTIHERLTGPYALAFLHVDVHALGNRVFLLGTVIGHNVDFALAFGDFTELHHTIDLADDGRLAWFAGLEQLDYARQT